MRILDWMQKKRKQSLLVGNLPKGFDGVQFSQQSALDCFYPEKSFELPSPYVSGSFQIPCAECEDSFLGCPDDNFSKTCKDISSIASSILFHGFLTIGTLGLDPIDESPVPEEVEKEVEIISEKLLDAEGEDLGEKLAVDDLVFSTTIAFKEMKAGERGEGDARKEKLLVEGNGFMTTEIPEKEKVTVLDMFQTAKKKGETSTKRKKTARLRKYSKQFFRNFFKQDQRYKETLSVDVDQNPIEAVKKKVKKILKLLGKKVHPETVPGRQEQEKNPAMAIKFQHDNDDPYFHMPALVGRPEVKDTMMVKRNNGHMSGGMPKENGENWIKTDENYFVLEL